MESAFKGYRGERYLDFPEVEAWCRAAAEAFPGWVSLEQVGLSRMGRPLWLLTLGDQSADVTARPAFWLDGATHAAEWTGVMAVLYTLSTWLDGVARGDAAVLDALRQTTVYAMPVICPDAFQALCEGAPFVRSTLRPPHEGVLRVGLDPRDMDGDGAVRWMRWRHPAGPWVHDADVPMCMRPRTLDDDPADAWFMCDEGELICWDGVRWTDAPLEFGLDLNRNFPAHWEPFRMFGMDGGAFPMSEPESRAVVDAFAARPNVGAALTNHTYTGALLTQPYRDPSPLGRGDIDLMENMARQAVSGTGYRAIRVSPDFQYDPKKAIVGVWADTLTTVFGVPGYTLELWDPFQHTGVSLPKPAEFFANPDPALVRQMVQKFVEGGAEVEAWRAFEHPQLGSVEIGGIDYMRTVRNPPVALLAEECEKGYRIAERLRRALPALEVQAQVERRDGVSVLSAVLENLGYLPTSCLGYAETQGLNPGLRVTLTLGEGLRLIDGEVERSLGHLDGWGTQLVSSARHAIYPGLPGRGHRAVARWVIAGQGEARLQWWSKAAGQGEMAIKLG